LPIFLIFFIGSIAETNRAPFDLAEAESELVSGFMTEHAAVIFVFFFLAEYASIVLICILSSILFLGGYLLNISFIINIIEYILYIMNSLGSNQISNVEIYNNNIYNSLVDGIFFSLLLAIKACILIFIFI
jgi:NADH-ubiquinone oxidoreductase chain 1